jgi:hypothetical protein
MLTPSEANLSILGVFKKGYLLENPTASCGWSSTKTNRKFGFLSFFSALKLKVQEINKKINNLTIIKSKYKNKT